MTSSELYTLLQNSILNAEPLVHPYLCDPPRGCISDRVAIYAEGFYSRLEETLSNDYATLAELVGDEFTQLSRLYTLAYPSHHFSLNFFGKNMSQFLIEKKPFSERPYLAEVASFEWAEYQAIVAKDAEVLSVSSLQSVPLDQWPNMTFHLHPSFHIIPTNWNSLSIIKASRENKRIPKPKKLKNPKSIVVWRRNLEVRYCELKGAELTMLNAIQQGSTFVEICEHLTKDMPENEVASYLVKELYAWLQEQLFIQYPGCNEMQSRITSLSI